MDISKDHLSYRRLYDAAHKTEPLEVLEWQHLHECDECMLRLANIIQIRIDLQELRKKYSA